MSINPEFLNQFIKATEKAAYGASKFIGQKDKIGADKGAVDPLRNELNKINMRGTVVIGEGEMDEAPMLYIGEKLGTRDGPELDIAVDPLEGTKFTANNQPNAFSVLAVAEKGNLLSAPDTYMEKIAIGANLPNNLLDLDYGVKKNINLLADAKNKKPSELTACVLKRPRHDHIVKELLKMDVKINFITDGDIAGALTVIGVKPVNDIYYSTGGGPEGVIVAAALSCFGGQIQGRLILDNKEIIRAKKLGIVEMDKKYNIDDIIKGDVIFCASGVTTGDLAKGVQVYDDKFEVTTFALHKDQNINKTITNIYKK
ncbi:MAG: fructose-1,6-bisphosphatase II / sedoheptulose-1,7-bisphosphatase [Pelagibacterales bacterium]|nr:fructose-1,6-bisphosphatase II / sedoheptulose-1,7-bisphosphatase [Pelagibacterales bacterium]